MYQYTESTSHNPDYTAEWYQAESTSLNGDYEGRYNQVYLMLLLHQILSSLNIDATAVAILIQMSAVQF